MWSLTLSLGGHDRSWMMQYLTESKHFLMTMPIGNLMYSCVDLSFCWFTFDTGTLSLLQNMLLIVKDKLSSSFKSLKACL